MTQGNYTPGPWEEVTPADDIWPPRVFAGSKIICMVDNSDMPQSEKLANARLTAAAPDMLEACQIISDCASSAKGMTAAQVRIALDMAANTARAAIARATGEKP